VEIVIGVDRKSKDKTYSIAKQYADVLFEFDFKNDFAEIRNLLIKKSSGKWILISDGHEEWEGIDRIPEIIIKSPNDVNSYAFYLELSPAEGGTVGQQIRLFKNIPGKMYYEGAMHNKLNADTSKSYATDIVKIYHDRNKILRGQRYKQRQKMLIDNFEQILKENPFDARANYYLATYYLSEAASKNKYGEVVNFDDLDKNMIKKSIPYFERYIGVSDFYEEKYLAKWFLLQAYLYLDKDTVEKRINIITDKELNITGNQKAKEIAYDMFEQMNEYPLAQNALGGIYLDEFRKNNKKRSLALAEYWFKNARDKKNIYFVSCFFPKNQFTYIPYDKLTEIYSIAANNGQPERVRDAYLTGLKTLEFNDYPENKKQELTECIKQWESIIGINDENINSDRSGDRQHDNVNTIDISNSEVISNKSRCISPADLEKVS